VTVGRSNDELTEITAGLSVGEEILLDKPAAKPETPKPDAPRPEAPKPDAAKSDAAAAPAKEAAKPADGAQQPDAPK
jgi:hypothetical protein